MSIVFTHTQAGIDAITNSNGLAAVIAHIGFGAGSYTPTRSETALQAEQDRIAITSNTYNGDQITLSATLLGNQSYEIREMGIFLEDGTLFVIYSHPNNLIAYKSAGTDFEFIYTLSLSSIDAGNTTLNVSAFGEAALQAHVKNKSNRLHPLIKHATSYSPQAQAPLLVPLPKTLITTLRSTTSYKVVQ